MTSKAPKKSQDFQLEERRDFIQKKKFWEKSDCEIKNFVSEFFGEVMKKKEKKFYKNFYFQEITLEKIKGKNGKFFYIVGLLLRKTDSSSSKPDEVRNFH